VAVFAAIKILAESVAQLPLRVIEGDEDSVVQKLAPNHPAYPLLRRAPNDEMTTVVFLETMQGNLCGWGNCYARIILDGGGHPCQLLWLPPDTTFAERRGGKLSYVSSRTGDRFAPEEIIHVPGLGFNGLKGYSPIGLAREGVALGKALELQSASFIGNGSKMSGVISFDRKLTPQQRQELRESWEKLYSGITNTGRTAVLDGGAKFHTLSISPQDAQFIEERRFQVLEVARLFRIPPHMLGEMMQGTGKNIEQMALEFLDTLNPWLIKWEQELTRKLCGPGYHVKFDTKKLRRADIQSRQQYYASLRQWGAFSANDVLRHEGENPIGKQGDIYLTPLNMGSAEWLVDGELKPPGMSPSDAPPGESESEQPPGEGSERSARACTALRPVFADAIGQALRREAINLRRCKSGEDVEQFYENHVECFERAMGAPVKAMCRLLDRPPGPRVAEVIRSLALERHGHGPDDTADFAEKRAGELITALVDALGE
jgi:HK97 family phage portal protein